MIAKILFRGFNFICGCLVMFLLTGFSAGFLGLVADPKHGNVMLGDKTWSEFLADSIARGWKHMFNLEN